MTEKDTATKTRTNAAITLLLKQAQTVITFVYLIMVAIGMLYYHQKYSEFGINIFQYANIFYFLVAPFEDVFIFLLCGAAVILFFVGYYLDHFIKDKMPRFYTFMNLGLNKKSWSKTSQAISWPIVFILMLVVYSQIYGERAKRIVLESEPITITFSDSQIMAGQMIGKTDSTLFLLDGAVVKAIPLSSEVKEIIINTSFSRPDEEKDEEKDEAKAEN